MLSYQIERVVRAREIDQIVIATTTNETDDPVAAFARAEGLGVYRGPEMDVLERYRGAAEAFEADPVVRLTADCPLADPAVIDLVIRRLCESDPPCDYVTNGVPRSYPAGLDAEALTRKALDIAAREATDAYDREHVTPFIYRNTARFRCLSVVSDLNLADERWTLDDPRDFELIRHVIEELYPTNPCFGMLDVIAILDQHPEWRDLNRDVRENPRVVDDVVFTGE